MNYNRHKGVLNIKKKKAHGHYCKICGQHKSNESFSGKGHANHICKACSRLSAEEKSEAITINRLMTLPMRRLTDCEKKWLKNCTHDKRPAVREMATQVYRLHFPHAERNIMKKQLRIDDIRFVIDTDPYFENPDAYPMQREFWLNRQTQVLQMRELNGTSEPFSIQLPRTEVAKLLKWMLHSLEIFRWDQDYCCGFVEEEMDHDFVLFGIPKSADEADESNEKNKVPWRVRLKYHDGHEQHINGQGGLLPGRVEELYFAFAEYFEDIDDVEDEDYDFLDDAFGCRDLLALSYLTSELLQCARDGNEVPLALAWMDLITQQDEIRQSNGQCPYHIHSGAAACVNFMLSFVTSGNQEQASHNCSGIERLEEFVRYVEENIVPPIGPLISESEIDMVLAAIEKKYRLFQLLFREQKLIILRIANTHTTFNSICNTVHPLNNNSAFVYNLFLFHTKGLEAGHPVYIFLHELGHIFQVELTHNPECVPDSFLEFLHRGSIEMMQGPQAVELFADTFAMAMMCSFDWSDYDPFVSIPNEAKNYMRRYMELLMNQIN